MPTTAANNNNDKEAAKSGDKGKEVQIRCGHACVKRVKQTLKE